MILKQNNNNCFLKATLSSTIKYMQNLINSQQITAFQVSFDSNESELIKTEQVLINTPMLIKDNSGAFYYIRLSKYIKKNAYIEKYLGNSLDQIVIKPAYAGGKNDFYAYLPQTTPKITATNLMENSKLAVGSV